MSGVFDGKNYTRDIKILEQVPAIMILVKTVGEYKGDDEGTQEYEGREIKLERKKKRKKEEKINAEQKNTHI